MLLSVVVVVVDFLVLVFVILFVQFVLNRKFLLFYLVCLAIDWCLISLIVSFK